MSLLQGVVLFYTVMSFLTLLVYAWDKHAAKRPGAPRVRESTLHLWALAGGFLGAWLGQVCLRHKTRHTSFFIVTILAGALHLAGWSGWWFAQ